MKPPDFINSVSIVIASFQRLDLLRDTIASVRGIRIPQNVACDLIVVDNDPDGGARDLVGQLMEECLEFPIRYIHETNTGLSHARNRGFSESTGQIIASLDDDVYVDPAWLCEIIDCFERTGADIVGGRATVHWDEAPDAILSPVGDRLLGFDHGDGEHQMTSAKVPIGANVSFRRGIFDTLKFSTDLGRIGRQLLSGEDTMLFQQVQMAGGSIWYCGAAAVQHRMGGARAAWPYVIRQRFWFGRSYAVIDQRLFGRAYQLKKALRRTVKIALIDLPHLAFRYVAGNASDRLPIRCSLAKQVGYVWSTVFPPKISVATSTTKPVQPVAPPTVPEEVPA